MPAKAPAQRRESSQTLILWLLRLLALAALAVCAYLFIQTVALNQLPVGCGVGSGCDQALSSRWSKWMNIPVSMPAAAVYFFLFVGAILADPAFELSTRRTAWRAMSFLAAVAAGSAVWFIIVQKIFVGSFCPWCLSAHLCGLLIAGLIFLSSRAQLERKTSPRASVRGHAGSGRPRYSQFPFSRRLSLVSSNPPLATFCTWSRPRRITWSSRTESFSWSGGIFQRSVRRTPRTRF